MRLVSILCSNGYYIFFIAITSPSEFPYFLTAAATTPYDPLPTEYKMKLHMSKS